MPERLVDAANIVIHFYGMLNHFEFYQIAWVNSANLLDKNLKNKLLMLMPLTRHQVHFQLMIWILDLLSQIHL